MEKLHGFSGIPGVVGVFNRSVFILEVFVLCPALLPIPANSQLLQPFGNVDENPFIPQRAAELLPDAFLGPDA